MRFNNQIAEPKFISFYLNSSGGRRQLFKYGKTTSGLNTISTSNVKNTSVLLPPIKEQKRFLNAIIRLNDIKANFANFDEDSFDLFHSLIKKAFRGEL